VMCATMIDSKTTTHKRPLSHRRLSRWRWSILLLAGLALLLPGVIPLYAAPLAAPLAQSSSDPVVLAFYYPWFDQNTWTYDTLSDLPAEPYVSTDRGVMGRQIDQAKRAGIDAFLVAWYGPGDNNQTETNLAAMLEEANARGFKIGVLFETTSPFFGGAGDVTAALQHLQATHFNSPAFLRVDGRPVVFFWRPTLYGVDTWRGIRSQVDPNYTNIWISEGIDTSYLAVFDGHHLYSNTWNPPADLTSVNQKFANQVAAARDAYGASKIWVATVMPGYNDVKVRGGFARDREGGNYFAQSWAAAIASNPSWIVINSFNEWPEGSYIEPSAAFGDIFLGISASYSQQFKSGGGAAIAMAPPPPIPTQPPPTPTPPPTVPTAYVNTSLLNLRAGPNTDAEIVGQVASGTALPISGQDPAFPQWWQVTYNDNPAWVFGELITTGGPMDQVAVLAGTTGVASANTATASTALTQADTTTQVAAIQESASDATASSKVVTGGAGVALAGGSAFAASNAPIGPQLDPHYQPVLPYLAR
jgi:uncharacterized protein YgiM (DUF1202 family)